MKDSQHTSLVLDTQDLSISRRIMKDSQPQAPFGVGVGKYIKANNERFSTDFRTNTQWF